jgi:hypothetical protein
VVEDAALEPLPPIRLASADGAHAEVPCHRWSGQESLLTQHCDPTQLFLTPAQRTAWSVPDSWFPILLAGPLGGYTNDICRPSPAVLDDSRAMWALLDGLRAAGDRFGARSSALMYLTPSAARQLRPALDHDQRLLFTSAACHLAVPWLSFDEYLEWLGHRRRSVVLRDLARFARSGCEVVTSRLAPVHVEAAPLLGVLLRRYGHAVGDQAALSHLREVARILDPSSVVFSARHEGRLVGFALFFEWHGALVAHKVGFDEHLDRSWSVYFQVTFYSAIQHAIRRRLERIELGLGSWYPKLLRGARPEPRCSLVIPPAGQRERWWQAVAWWNDAQAQVWQELFGPLARGHVIETWMAEL